ncbi:MAG TPA: hypothetical protein VF221_10555 [Chloroflexota bacterium]
MDDPAGHSPEDSERESNPDWDRTISLEEAQKTAREADPDDLGSTSPDSGMMAGGDDTEIGPDIDLGGGTPYTEGYVTGGSHNPTIADLPRDSREH